jgi:hypothetical protein
MHDNDELRVEIRRHLYNRVKFNNEYLKKQEEKQAYVEIKRKVVHNTSKAFFKILKLFTIFPWFTGYNLKKQLFKDFISGLTVGIMHIPQGNLVCWCFVESAP